MQNARRDGLALVLVAACALGVGACRHTDERAYGSIKDAPVASPAKARTKVAKAKPRADAETVRVMPAVMAPAPVAMTSVQQTSAAIAVPAAAPSNDAARADQPAAGVKDEATANRLLGEGQSLFEAGQVQEARRVFMTAMAGPVPGVMLALGRSYDTYYLSRLPKSDAAPDMQRALVLYERAVDVGATDAMADLERTRGILKIPR